MNKLLKTLRNEWARTPQLILILAALICTDAVVLLNIPVIRQFLGLITFSVIPGYTLLLCLHLDGIERLEKALFSIGLSLFILFSTGLVLNYFGPLVGVTAPISTLPITLTLTAITVVLSLVSYRTNAQAYTTFLVPSSTPSEYKILLSLAIILCVTIFGVNVMNVYAINAVVLLSLLLIVLVAVVIALKDFTIRREIYALIIFVLGLSIVYMYTLRGAGVLGDDVVTEFAIFQSIVQNSHFAPTGSLYDSAMGVTLLPAVFNSVINVQPEYVYKGLLGLFIALAPVALFALYSRYVTDRYAFLAAFFFISQVSWFSYIAMRTYVAIFFLSLVLLALFCAKIPTRPRSALVIIFITATVMTHYATSYVAIAVLFLAWLIQPALMREQRPRRITIAQIFMFIVLGFAWYAFVAERAFLSTVDYVSNFATSINSELFLRGETSQAILTFSSNKGSIFIIHLFLNYFIYAVITLGIVIGIRKYRRLSVTDQPNQPTKSWRSQKIDVDFLSLGCTSIVLLIAFIALPYVNASYDLGRVNLTLLLFLSVFFVTGLDKISQLLRANPAAVVSLLLAINFIFNSHLAYELTGTHDTIALTDTGVIYQRLYIYPQETAGVKWLSASGNHLCSTVIYGDLYANHNRLAMVLSPRIHVARIQLREPPGPGYVYLRYANVKENTLNNKTTFYNTTDYLPYLNGSSKVFSDGGSDIFYNI